PTTGRARQLVREILAQKISSVSRGALQFLECAALRLVGRHRPFDTIHRQAGDPRGARVADLRQIALRLLLIGVVGAQRVESRLLLPLERLVELLPPPPPAPHPPPPPTDP